MSGAHDPWPEHCRRELVAAMLEAAELFPHSGQDRADRIHEARRALKKARALVRLFVMADDLAAYDVISALDKARRSIGQARNLDVMPAVLKSLAGEVDAGTSEQLITAIAFEREVTRIAHSDVDVNALATQLRTLARAIEAWDLSPITTATLLKIVRTTYRSARRLGRKAFADGASGELHDLRTVVVELGYQFASFQAAWPALFTVMTAEMQKLRQQLGDVNDLTMLAEFANSRHDLSLTQMSNLALKIERRQGRLARRAQARFARLFTERPGALEKRLAAYLENSKTKAKAL